MILLSRRKGSVPGAGWTVTARHLAPLHLGSIGQPPLPVLLAGEPGPSRS
jgi:hypothetical protein